MANQLFEITADSLASAREQAKARVPSGQRVVSEVIVCDGLPQRTVATADSVNAAFTKARHDLPKNCQIVQEKELFAPHEQRVEVTAFDEEAAKVAAEAIIDRTASIIDVKLKTSGSKGFLGIGRTPHVYELDVFQPAVVEITFRRQAHIRVEVGEKPPTGYCQMCGRSNCEARTIDRYKYFFCSSACSERYSKQKIGASLFGPDTAIFNASGRDLGGLIASGREATRSATSHCWSCGGSVPMSKDRCGLCGKEQQVPS